MVPPEYPSARPLDVLFVTPNPPSETGTAIGARLSNNRMWSMIGSLTNKAEVISVKEAVPQLALANRLEDTQPRTILIETPGVSELNMLDEAIPSTMHNRVSALWRYTVVPRQPLPGTTDVEWHALLAARRKFANMIGLNICISAHQRLELLSIGVPEENIIVIPNQVGWDSTPAKRRGPDAERLRARHLYSDELGILVVSRIHPEKGLEWLPSFIKTLRSERRYLSPHSPYKKACITLTGPVGEERFWTELHTRINETIANTAHRRFAETVTFEYVGETKGNQLDDLFNSHDVLLAPSPEEGFPRVPVEAMASGMTVVGNGNCPSTAHILTQAPYTIGQTAPDPEKAAIQVLRMMDTPELLAVMQQNASRWSRGNYTFERALGGLRHALKL